MQAVEAVWDAGFVVVASAGNYGSWGNFTVTSPGNSRTVRTSARGPTLVDHVLKPDLLAPGNRFVATSASGSYLHLLLSNGQTLNCGGLCEYRYLELSGTSMASAMVSGTAALMLSLDPTLTRRPSRRG